MHNLQFIISAEFCAICQLLLVLNYAIIILTNERMVDYMKMMALEEAKEYTRQKLAPYYSNERIENVVKHYVSVVRPGVVLVENKNVGLMELYL